MKHRLILFIWALALSLVTSLAQAVTCRANMPPASNPDSAYSDNGDGTVTHTPTGLIWKRCAEGQIWSGGTCTGSVSSHTWVQALTLASTSSFAGKSDWRLPSIKELRSLVEECRYSPAINDTIFPNTTSSNFWSGSPDANDSALAWGVNFSNGGANGYNLRSYSYRAVRLVRGGQSFDNLGANPQPDLVVSSLTAPATGTVGGQITISATVTNQGTASAAAYTLGLYLSSDSSVTTSDTFISSCTLQSMAAGASASCSGPVTIPSTLAPGNYYFGAIADATGVVSESNEGNNSKAIPIVVSAAQTQVSTVRPIFPRSASDVSEVMQGGQILRWYVLEATNGTSVANQQVRYQISGEAEKTATTDADGLFAITSDAQTILSSNKDEIQHKTVNFVGAGSQDFGFTVATRSLEQTWLMEASLKGELGYGPAFGVETNIAGMGAKFKKGWSVGFGLGGTYGVSAVHKANMNDDGYLYATSAQTPSNHALSTSRTLGLEASVNAKSEFGIGIKQIAPATFVGLNLSPGTEIKGTAKWAATAQFPSYFDPVNPIGPCHFGWQVTSDLYFLGVENFIPDGYTPVEFLCGAPLSNFLSESKQSTTFGGTIGFGAKVGLNGYAAPSENDGYKTLKTLSIAGGIEGAFQISGESTQKYKVATPSDKEEKIELLYGFKMSGDAGAYLRQLHTVMGETFKGKLNLKYADGIERKLSRTVVYNSAGAWKGAKLGVTFSSIAALSSGSEAGAIQTVQEDLNATIETDNAQDFAAIPGMPMLDWSIFNPSNIDKALTEALSPSAQATVSPLKWGVETERFFPVRDVSFDLGAAFGLKFKAGAGVKLSPSEKYQIAVAKIANANLGGQSKRVKFVVEYYADDQYLAEQRKSPIAIANQMGVAISNFANKILASAKAKAAQVGEFVVAQVNVASDKVSQLRVQAGEASEEWYLTVERWYDGIKLFSSPIYLARNFATSQTEAVIGPIHFVNAKTAAGVERDALPNAAILTIGQVSQYLSSANLAATLVNQVRVYRLDFDTATKTLVGGTYQAGTDQLTVNITRTGAYIMVIDTKAPTINSGLVASLDSASGNLRVGALLDQDATGVNSASITLRVNGVNVLANVPVSSYFNLATNNFGYVVPKSHLMVGSNEIQFSVADGAGNQQTVSTQVVVEASVCVLNANPANIAAGGSATLTATCTPAATSYVWTGGACAGTTAATCTVTPTDTTTYTVAGVIAGRTGAAASATVTVTTANTGALQPNADGTVFDPKTGLTWMRCAMGQTWNGSTCSGTASSYTFGQANALTGTVTFASQNDWRMPNIRELQTIVDRSVSSPAIDSAAFPNTPSLYFWSSSPSAYQSGNALYVGFDVGFAYGVGQSDDHAVRLVRGGQSSGPLLSITRPTSDYVDNGNGTVTHTPTNLTWKRCAQGQTWTGSTCSGTASSHTFDQANVLTGATTFAGQSDWRVPTEDELLSLVDYTIAYPGPAINSILFPATPSSAFWSSSLLAYSSSSAWTVYFPSGDAMRNYDSSYVVRLVRGGQPSSSVTLTISKIGTGTGTVTSTPAGINCGSTCSAAFASGASVTLTATPTTGSTFTGWSGACNGTGSCTVSMTAAQSVIATFANACSNTLNPASASVAATASTGSVSVTSSCAWTAASNASWITITSGASGSGNGTVAYAVAANTGTTTRTGTLTIAGQTFTVTQAAGSTVSAPVCSLSANPSSITAGGTSTLTATCNPPATGYIWTGGTCSGTSASSCTVTPTATTTYSVQGSNAGGTNQAVYATVTVKAPTTESYAVPGTFGNDVFVLTAGNSYYGGGGNDTFIISPNTLHGDVTAKIIDSEGDNLIQLVDGTTITASSFYADAAQLTLSSGAKVQILGASKFKYQLGANALAGDTAVVRTYSDFVTSLGASLSGTLPASGTAGYVVPTGFTQAAAPVSAVAGTANFVPGTVGDDVLAPSGGNSYLGGGGGDTYIISPYVLSGTVTAKIIDTEGSNVIQLVKGLTIASSSFFNNAVQLMLSNGATVQILGASGFGYQLGANAPAGETASSLSYSQFAATLGASVPAAGAAAVSGSSNFLVSRP